MVKLLVPVDFSDPSDNACQYALRLAAKMGAEVNLVHYYNDLLISEDMPPVKEQDATQKISADILRAPADQARDSLDELCRELTGQLRREKISGVALSHTFIWGNPEDGILETCKNEPYNLVIMGSNGEGGKLFAGSLTMKTIKKSAVPVMAVPPDSRYRNIRHVLYATDFEAADYQAITKLFGLFEAFNIAVSCVHVSEKEGDVSEPLGQMEDLKGRLSGLYPGRMTFQVIQNPDVTAGLNEFTEKEHADIIAMTRHGRNLLEKILSQSTTREVLSHTRIPLLAFHT